MMLATVLDSLCPMGAGVEPFGFCARASASSTYFSEPFKSEMSTTLSYITNGLVDNVGCQTS